MRPIRLTMYAFGSYGRETTVDFTVPQQNLFLVTGTTGAGKTTIFDALVFALYGESGSMSNKKDGSELQSQFAKSGTQPFVELEFSERVGSSEKIYRVRRSPRYRIPTRKTESSYRLKLTMPDGREYTQDDAKQQLSEILTLTKDQFMQVAMIAQGEFMNMLRETSKERCKVFRRLFNTEIYEGIINEVKKRVKDKGMEIAQIRTACKTEAGHITVPEAYERAACLTALKERVLASDRLSVTDMGSLLEELTGLCTVLEEGRAAAQAEYDKMSKKRDESRETLTKAENLLKFFEQLESAQAALEKCESEAEAKAEKERLVQHIDAAFEIQALFVRYRDAERAAAETAEKLAAEKERLPELEKACSVAEAAFEAAKKELSDETENFNRVSERVKAALETFEKINAAEQNVNKKEMLLSEAHTAEERARTAFDEHDKKEKEWRRQTEELADADKNFALWQVKSAEADGMLEELSAVKAAGSAAALQKKTAEKAAKAYSAAKKSFDEQNKEYLRKNSAFLDAQAGFIAKEYLKEGQPCPVCGSIDHPLPCVLSEEHRELTRNIIEALAAENAKLLSKMEKCAADAGTAAEGVTEKEQRFNELLEKLGARMAKGLGRPTEGLTEEKAEIMLSEWRKEVDAEGRELTGKVKRLAELKQLLERAVTDREKLSAMAEKASRAVTDANTALAESKAELKTVSAGVKDYSTADEAQKALSNTQKCMKEKSRLHGSAERTAREALNAVNNSGTLMASYEKALPDLQRYCEDRRGEYTDGMSRHSLTEAEWKELAERHKKADAERLRREVADHSTRKAAAENLKASASKAIDGQPKPELEVLSAAAKKAEEELGASRERLDRLREHSRINSEARRLLSDKMEERKTVLAEYEKLNELSEILGGARSGAHLDIETFVQRRYLERILYAANRRFRSMSGGQFELRMLPLELAGKGTNHGLDLMVHCNITNDEREVRTLSGGESFMAALSLALGMADQIRESSASVNLDIMFIDEGFGSLDDNARAQAIRVLKDMAGDSRLIGIISHVTELKQAIDDQLTVTRDENGSRVRWQIS